MKSLACMQEQQVGNCHVLPSRSKRALDRARETGKHTDTDTHRHRHRHTRQTHTGRQTHTHTHAQTHTHTHTCTHTHRHSHTRQTDEHDAVHLLFFVLGQVGMGEGNVVTWEGAAAQTTALEGMD